MHELSKIIDEASAEVTLSKDYGAGYFLDLKIEMPQFSDLRVETSTNTLLINDKKIKLTPIEAKILLMLMEAQGEKISGDLIRTKCEKDFLATNTSFDLVMHTMALHINLNTNSTRLNNKDGSFFLKAGRARPAKVLASAS
ncbi:MAG: hypothetical protein EOP04_13360 [Proteobacteria bacterium]|nr:MAG: hypothetical protein EOP04_13360 [Pseudomonadota bacterium]